MTQIEFDRLVEEIEQAFEKSEIKKHVENAGKNPWYYDICTRIVPQWVLVVGFNPGVKQNYDHERQNQFPDKTFMESLSDQGSMCRVGKYLEKYFSQHIKEKGNWSNQLLLLPVGNRRSNTKERSSTLSPDLLASLRNC